MDYRSRWQQKRRERATRQRLALIAGALVLAGVVVFYVRGIARPAPIGYQLPGPAVVWLGSTADAVLATTRTGALLKLTPSLSEAGTGWAGAFTHPAGFWGRPAVADGLVVVGCEDVRVRGVDAVSGVQSWELEVGGSVPGVTAAGAEVYFASTAPALHAVAADGTLIWRTPLEAEVAAAPLVTEETVVVGTLSGRVCAYERATGDRLWCVEPEEPEPIYASPAMGPSSVLVGDDAGRLHSIARSGELLASMEFEGLLRQRAGVRDAVVVAGDSAGLVRRINPADMMEVWETRLPGPLAAEPIVLPGMTWCAAGSTLVALDNETGGVLTRRVAKAETCDVIHAHGRIYWATTDGRIGAVSIED